MATDVTFDPVNKIITVDTAPTAGVVLLDVQGDLYSEAKRVWLNSLAHNKYQFPFRTIGGDDLGGGVKAGAYYFLRNDLGWRIRPYEDNHELVVAGNLFGNDANQAVYVPTVGAYTAMIRLSTSSLTQQVGGSAAETATAVWAALESNNVDPGSMGERLVKKLAAHVTAMVFGKN